MNGNPRRLVLNEEQVARKIQKWRDAPDERQRMFWHEQLRRAGMALVEGEWVAEERDGD